MGASIQQITGDKKMTINFKVPEIKELKPRILLLGVGGAGGPPLPLIIFLVMLVPVEYQLLHL